MKLTKEQVYINLQGKTKEELKELELITGLDSIAGFNYLHFNTHEGWNRWWAFTSWENDITKTEITIQQLKQIIKPMGTFTAIAMKCTQEQFNAVKPKLKEIGKIGNLLYAFEDDNIYLVNNYNGEKLFFDISVCYDYNRKAYEQWNEEIFLKACGIEGESLKKQLQKAEAEVKRLQSLMEEENKPKNGDICVMYNGNFKFITIFNNHEDVMDMLKINKIKDQELINKINELIK